MAKNITLLGASFPDVPSVVLPTAEGGTAEFFDTTDATLDNDAKILSGYTAYANGVKYSGTIPVNDYTNVTVSGATVTTASGYYSSAVTKSVISGELQDITFPAAPSVSVNTLTGMVTVSYSKTFSGIMPVTKTGYIPSTASISALIYGTSSYSLPTISGTTITPTDAFQTAIPAGTFATGDINVAAIPSDYLGPGVVPVSVTDVTFSGSEVTIPSGYYSEAITSTVASGALADVALGGALAGQATANYSQISTIPTAVSIDPITGEVTATFSKSFSGVTPVGSAGFLSTGASHNVNVYGTGTYSLSTVGARTITPRASRRLAVSSGYYTTGDVYVGAIPSMYVGSGVSRISGQTITPSSGSTLAISAGTYATGDINVGAIPSAYIIPSGTVKIIKNGIYNITHWESVNAAITPNLQSISITPGVDEQIVTPPEEEVGKNQIYCSDVTFVKRINIDFSTFAVGDTCHLYGRMYLFNGNNTYYPITIDESFPWEETNIRTYQVGNANRYKITLTNSYISFEALVTNYGGLYVHGVDPNDSCFHVYKKSYDGFSQVTVGAVPETSSANDWLTVANNTISGEIIGDSTVTVLKSCLFQLCSLISVASFPSCTRIGDHTFMKCSSLTTVSFPVCSSIGIGAFGYCNALTTISFPACTMIGNSAFYWCLSSLTTANFPVCASIGSSAFERTGLTTANFPKCVSIGEWAFNGCSSLTTVSFPVCTSIGSSAFNLCSSLTTVSFPVCTTIGSSTFFTTGLTIADFPECTSMYNNAFAYCTALSMISFPKCTYLGSKAFATCTSLTEVNFPACTTMGGMDIFQNCYSLTTANFPVCKMVQSYAFQKCSSLTTISFPVCMTIGPNAFNMCSSLSAINFPSCKTISASAFASCISLTTISFPALSSCATNAFKNCSSLISAYLLNSYVATGDISIFEGTPMSISTLTGSYGSIFVRESLLATWQSKANWSAYSSRFVGLTDEQIAELDASNGTNP